LKPQTHPPEQASGARSPGRGTGGVGQGRSGHGQDRPGLTLPLAIGLQAAIAAGDGLAMIALANRVYQSSHASWAVAAVFLAICVPISALAPVAGLVLDRLPTKPVLVASAAAEALVAVGLTLATGVQATLVLAAGFGVCAALLQPGLGAIVPRLVGPARVTRANSYLQAATWGGFTAGPLLAGLLITAGGSSVALAADALLYGLGALGLAALRLAPRRDLAGRTPEIAGCPPGDHPRPGTAGRPAGTADHRPGTTGHHPPVTAGLPSATPGLLSGPAGLAPDEAGGASFTGQMRAGFSFLRSDSTAGLLVLIVGVMVAFANMAVVAEVVFAEQVLGAGPRGYSLLVAGWTSGMVIGTLAGGRLPVRWLVVASLAGTVAAGAGVVLAGTAAVLWQAVAAYASGGLANGLETVATRSYLNHRAPEAVAGRVFALYSGVLFGAASIGMAAAAGMLTLLGARDVLLLAGSGGGAAGVAGCVIYAARRIAARRAAAGRGTADPGRRRPDVP
jgi:MFS family permease